jgi:hypothetical protein
MRKVGQKLPAAKHYDIGLALASLQFSKLIHMLNGFLHTLSYQFDFQRNGCHLKL